MAELIVGVNDLATVRPDLVKEWDFDKNKLKPDEVTCGSKRSVRWKCNKGHEYELPILRRVKGNCPYCSGQYILEGFNDLLSQESSLVKEWNYVRNGSLKPNKVTCNSGRKVWWVCKRGHEWEAKICNRTRGSGCPYCSNNKVLEGYNDLATLRPDLAVEWNYIKNDILPTQILVGSHKKVWWKCKEGHEWQSSVANRSNRASRRGTNCPYCSGKKAIKGYNDLVTVRPDLVKEWNYNKNIDILPDEIMCKSNKEVWWKCEKGHEWKATLNNRTRHNPQNACPYCNNRKLLLGYNDLVTLRPDLVKEWNYKRNEDLIPSMFKLNSSTKVWWVCEKGHEWEAKIQHRNNGADCPYCAKIYCNDRLIYNFKTKLIMGKYYKCECQKCGYSNILTIDEMKQHYDKCFGKG